MRTLTLITFIAVFIFPLQLHSETKIRSGLNQGKFLQDRVNDNPVEQAKQELPTGKSNNPDSKKIVNSKITDNGFLLIEEINQNWNGSNWINMSKYTYTYDINNDMIEELERSWDGSNWHNAIKNTYSYDINNNRILWLLQTWDGSEWVNSARYIFAYNLFNNMIEDLHQSWNYSQWINTHKNTYTYDINNNMTEELWQYWDIENYNWINSIKTTYTYDVSNNLIEEIHQNWNGGNWMYFAKATHTYDINNNLIERFVQLWISSNWTNDFMNKYTYDVNNDLIEKLWQDWDLNEVNWVNTEKLTYTYDDNNNRITELWQLWYNSNWTNRKYCNYRYIISEIEKFGAGVTTSVFGNDCANPFNPVTTIQYQIPKRSEVTIKVFSLLGQEVKILINKEQEAGIYEVEFNARDLPGGVYFYRVQAGDFMQTKKMVLLR